MKERFGHSLFMLHEIRLNPTGSAQVWKFLGISGIFKMVCLDPLHAVGKMRDLEYSYMLFIFVV